MLLYDYQMMSFFDNGFGNNANVRFTLALSNNQKKWAPFPMGRRKNQYSASWKIHKMLTDTFILLFN